MTRRNEIQTKSRVKARGVSTNTSASSLISSWTHHNSRRSYSPTTFCVYQQHPNTDLLTYNINTMPLSQSPILRPLCAGLGLFALGFGLNAVLNPAGSLSLFNLSYPDHPASIPVINALMQVYGIRDAFMGFTTIMTAYYGHRKVMGWTFIGVSTVATVDGFICRNAGVGGEWNHWSFTLLGSAVGMVLLGVFD